MNNNAVTVSGVSKTYNSTRVVDDVSFEVKSGEIFGLIGPNGAGKTTTIRMIMDIIKPDVGEIFVLGEKISNETKNHIGYLPEERGMYRKLKVIDSIVYLASLKGISTRMARSRAEELLDRVEMLDHANKKIEELSRGMGQLIQFLVTIIHDPGLVILDEPSAGLDPVNTELLKNLIVEMRSQGKAIIMSTHRMNEVEEMCDRIFMINRGKNVLYGKIGEIKARFRNNSIVLQHEGELPELTGIIRHTDYRDHKELFLDSGSSAQDILSQLIEKGIKVNKFEISTPSLNDIFIQMAGEE
ncbi:MAG TPA: ATP-binding cassette domain-containing protein [Dehalococcoidia bacterium]|nr:ATP-binding cassette domain-containing protein [Dehalococcoidia bacterium]